MAVPVSVRESWKNNRKEGFVLIDCEEECFCLLTLFHLNKIHVHVMCIKVSFKITVKLTSGCKV